MHSSGGFQHEPLAKMVAVGAVQARSVRLWLRSDRPGRVGVRWWPEGQEGQGWEAAVEIPEGNLRDNVATVEVPGDAGGAPPLEPLRRYRFRATHAGDGHLLGEGSFETAPEGPEGTPARFSVALMSCNQPFEEDGTVQDASRQMLRAAHRVLEAHDAKFVLMIGDQMYADYPHALSLFEPAYFARIAPPGRRAILDCTPQEVRRLYQERYRYFWSLPELQALFAAYPCYMMLDDHDIVDNWGSDPLHQTPLWEAVGEGARQAFLDYQGARVLPLCETLPEDFHYSFAYGTTATFVMDLRSSRRVGAQGRLYGPRQEEDLQAFLQAHRDKKVLFIVLSVPIIHVSRHLARLGAKLPSWGEDFSDRWSAEIHLRQRDRFLRILHEHQRGTPGQHLVLLSGDIHIGCAHRIRWRGGGPALYQLIASPITHTTGRWIQRASSLLIRLKREVVTADGRLRGRVSLLGGEAGCRRNPYGGLNVGLIEVETPAPDADPTIRLLLYGQRDGEPVCVYRSPPL